MREYIYQLQALLRENGIEVPIECVHAGKTKITASIASVTTPASCVVTVTDTYTVDLLHDLFGEVLIPEAVFDEVTSNASFQNEADVLLIDESKGRQVAQNMKLPVSGKYGCAYRCI